MFPTGKFYPRKNALWTDSKNKLNNAHELFFKIPKIATGLKICQRLLSMTVRKYTKEKKITVSTKFVSVLPANLSFINFFKEIRKNLNVDYINIQRNIRLYERYIWHRIIQIFWSKTVTIVFSFIHWTGTNCYS